jgi:hypothetical protein
VLGDDALGAVIAGCLWRSQGSYECDVLATHCGLPLDLLRQQSHFQHPQLYLCMYLGCRLLHFTYALTIEVVRLGKTDAHLSKNYTIAPSLRDERIL